MPMSLSSNPVFVSESGEIVVPASAPFKSADEFWVHVCRYQLEADGWARRIKGDTIPCDVLLSDRYEQHPSYHVVGIRY